MKEWFEAFENLITIDATHNTTQYGLKLITILEVDPLIRKSYPVLFSVSSRENASALYNIFKTLHQGGVSVHPSIIVPDDDNAQWKVAKIVFPSIYCIITCAFGILINVGENR